MKYLIIHLTEALMLNLVVSDAVSYLSSADLAIYLQNKFLKLY